MTSTTQIDGPRCGAEPLPDGSVRWTVWAPPSTRVDLILVGPDGRAWAGVSRNDLVIYELHVGTFTPAGTFDAVIPRLPELKRLGVTAVEIMPVAQFPGCRNWGYDGVFPSAVQNTYGGPEALQRL